MAVSWAWTVEGQWWLLKVLDVGYADAYRCCDEGVGLAEMVADEC